jgi:hypothetical protein
MLCGGHTQFKSIRFRGRFLFNLKVLANLSILVF